MTDSMKTSAALPRLLFCLVLAIPASSRGMAADHGVVDALLDNGAPMSRFFPRGDGIETETLPSRPRRMTVGCRPRQALVPTNAPDDPSYVGSEYGLSKPSYYGFTPPHGIDDPYGRPLLAYCR